VLVCAHDERHHLQTLARLSLMFHGSDLADRLVGVADAAEAQRIVLEMERTLMERRAE
jgi:hypothetical protein